MLLTDFLFDYMHCMDSASVTKNTHQYQGKQKKLMVGPFSFLVFLNLFLLGLCDQIAQQLLWTTTTLITTLPTNSKGFFGLFS